MISMASVFIPVRQSRRLSPRADPVQPAQHAVLLYTSFSLAGLDSAAGAPAAPRRPRLVQTTVAVMAVTLVSSLVALFVVGKLLGEPEPDSLCLPA